jgi:hypothetical protein
MVKRVLTKTLKLFVGDDLSLGLPKLRKKRPLKKLSERELVYSLYHEMALASRKVRQFQKLSIQAEFG